MIIQFVSWNVLADVYATKGSTIEPGTTVNPRSWPYRSNMLRDKLAELNADVFCLQEVDHYKDFYLPTLAKIGMKSIYFQRPQKKDGCLISFRESRFELCNSFDLDLDCLTSLDDHLSYGRSKYQKNNVAHFAHLFDTFTGQDFIAANCHIHWNPNVPEVKLAQVTYILSQLALFKTRENLPHTPVIWSGDFNSLPDSEVYSFLTACIAEREFKVRSQALTSALTHSLRLDSLYGPNTKFLVDMSLSRLTRWLRILGVYSATVPCSGDSSYINSIFDKARRERRVFLTTSKGLLERSSCPAFSRYINPAKQAEAMVDLFRDFGLVLRRDRFLTVCGKCGGEISEAKADDVRLLGKIVPTDRTVYACLDCSQPYWWSEVENSSPAKALRKAEELYTFLMKELGQVDLKADHLSSDTAATTSAAAVAAAEEGNGVQRVDITPLQEHIKEEKTSTSAEVLDAEAEDEDTLPLPPTAAVTKEAETADDDDVEAANATATQAPLEPVVPAVLPQLRSVFIDHGQAEPLLTNWSGDFKGTLDYILIGGDNIRTRSAVIIPAFDLSSEGSHVIGGDVITASQPSAQWPSDHFAVVTELEIFPRTSTE